MAAAAAAQRQQQRAAPSGAQLLCQIILGPHCQAPRSGGFTHICQESRTSGDKANDAGDNAEPSQDVSLLEKKK